MIRTPVLGCSSASTRSGAAFIEYSYGRAGRGRHRANLSTGPPHRCDDLGGRPAPGSTNLAEAELLLGLFNPDANAQRVEPPRNAIPERPFASRIADALPNAAHMIAYPEAYSVGKPRGTGIPVISGRIWSTYASRENHVTLESTAGRYPIEIIPEFTPKVRKKGVTDIRLTLPVNHEQAFVDFVDFGFRPVAYLPGWCLRGSHRFDCLQMVAGLPRPSGADTKFMERAAAKVSDGLLAIECGR